MSYFCPLNDEEMAEPECDGYFPGAEARNAHIRDVHIYPLHAELSTLRQQLSVAREALEDLGKEFVEVDLDMSSTDLDVWTDKLLILSRRALSALPKDLSAAKGE